MELGQPFAFHWIWLALGAALLVWFAYRGRRRAAARWADAPLFARIAPRASVWRPVVRGVLVVLTLAALALAMVDPRAGSTTEEVRRRGIDVYFVVDVSRSMLAEDVAPNRLDRSKQLVLDTLDRLGGDRAGLIAFAGTSSIRSPLTLNYGALRLAVNELAPQDADRGGSLLGDAIRLAADSFTDEVKSGKAIVVLSDGEDMESFPVEAARKAYADRGIRVYTIGLGDSRDGARIPALVDGQRSWLVHEGQEVWSKMDPSLLTETALAGGGAFVPAGTTHVDMAEVWDATVDAVGRRDFETQLVTRAAPQFGWFVMLALGLLIAEWLVPGARAAHAREGSSS